MGPRGSRGDGGRVDVDIDCVEHETDMAWLVEIDGRQYWLPKSQCDVDEARNVASVAEWLAIKQGLI